MWNFTESTEQPIENEGQYETLAWSRAYTQHSLESQWRPHRENSKLTDCRDL